jgi:hypothetical protein
MGTIKLKTNPFLGGMYSVEKTIKITSKDDGVFIRGKKVIKISLNNRVVKLYVSSCGFYEVFVGNLPDECTEEFSLILRQ